MKIKRFTIFTKSVLYCLICAIIAFAFIVIINKYAISLNANIGDILEGLEQNKIFYQSYSVLNNVFGFNEAIGAYVGGWFAIFFSIAIVGAVVILISWVIFKLAGVMGGIGARY